MIYSVWDWQRRQFDYFEDEKDPPFAPDKRSLPGRKAGVAPEEAAIKVPKEAVKTGSGTEAKGFIAVQGVDGFDFKNPWLLAGLGLAAYGIWRMYARK